MPAPLPDRRPASRRWIGVTLAAVLGIGLNVTTRAHELPATAPTAPTSVAMAGGSTTDRDTLLRAVLRALG